MVVVVVVDDEEETALLLTSRGSRLRRRGRLGVKALAEGAAKAATNASARAGRSSRAVESSTMVSEAPHDSSNVRGPSFGWAACECRKRV